MMIASWFLYALEATIAGMICASGRREQRARMLVGVLVGRAFRRERIVGIEHAEIGARFGPDIVGFGRMNVRIVSAGRRQNAAVVRGVCDLFADMDD
jgi:hypothetical protein